jgi:hypothetical protein
MWYRGIIESFISTTAMVVVKWQRGLLDPEMAEGETTGT